MQYLVMMFAIREVMTSADLRRKNFFVLLINEMTNRCAIGFNVSIILLYRSHLINSLTVFLRSVLRKFVCKIVVLSYLSLIVSFIFLLQEIPAVSTKRLDSSITSTNKVLVKLMVMLTDLCKCIACRGFLRL